MESVKGNLAVLGSRMMGGGFGGCTINLVQEDAIDALVEKITKEYKDATTLDLTAYVAETENGSALV